MEAPGSTTLVVIGEEAPAAIHALDGFANVRAAAFGTDRVASDDDVARWSAGAASTYVVHDRDPLAHLAAAWVEFFDDQTSYGVLELEIERAVAAASHHRLAVPDYYVVLEPETLPVTWKHWWLGVIAGASPSRVIPWHGADDPLLPLLRHLPTGRPWPDAEHWLPSVAGAVPDRVGI